MSKIYLKHCKHRILFSHIIDLFKPNGICNPIGFQAFFWYNPFFICGVAGHIMFSLLWKQKTPSFYLTIRTCIPSLFIRTWCTFFYLTIRILTLTFMKTECTSYIYPQYYENIMHFLFIWSYMYIYPQYFIIKTKCNFFIRYHTYILNVLNK